MRGCALRRAGRFNVCACAILALSFGPAFIAHLGQREKRAQKTGIGAEEPPKSLCDAEDRVLLVT